MLKILQARLQQYVNHELLDVKLYLEKAEEPENNWQQLLDHQKATEFQKNIYFCFIDYTKAFDCVNQELSDLQARIRKGRRTRDQIANIHWIIEKAREFQKKNIWFIDYDKVFVWVTINCGKVFNKWE